MKTLFTAQKLEAIETPMVSYCQNGAAIFFATVATFGVGAFISAAYCAAQ